LAEDGIIVVALTIDSVTNEIVSGPEVVSRGFVYVKENEQLIDDAREIACDILEKCYLSRVRDYGTIKTRLRDGVSRFVYEKTRRSPMVLPIILEI